MSISVPLQETANGEPAALPGVAVLDDENAVTRDTGGIKSRARIGMKYEPLCLAGSSACGAGAGSIKTSGVESGKGLGVGTGVISDCAGGISIGACSNNAV